MQFSTVVHKDGCLQAVMDLLFAFIFCVMNIPCSCMAEAEKNGAGNTPADQAFIHRVCPVRPLNIELC